MNTWYSARDPSRNPNTPAAESNASRIGSNRNESSVFPAAVNIIDASVHRYMQTTPMPSDCARRDPSTGSPTRPCRRNTAHRAATRRASAVGTARRTRAGSAWRSRWRPARRDAVRAGMAATPGARPRPRARPSRPTAAPDRAAPANFVSGTPDRRDRHGHHRHRERREPCVEGVEGRGETEEQPGPEHRTPTARVAVEPTPGQQQRRSQQQRDDRAVGFRRSIRQHHGRGCQRDHDRMVGTHQLRPQHQRQHRRHRQRPDRVQLERLPAVEPVAFATRPPMQNQPAG